VPKNPLPQLGTKRIVPYSIPDTVWTKANLQEPLAIFRRNTFRYCVNEERVVGKKTANSSRGVGVSTAALRGRTIVTSEVALENSSASLAAAVVQAGDKNLEGFGSHEAEKPHLACEDAALGRRARAKKIRVLLMNCRWRAHRRGIWLFRGETARPARFKGFQRV